MGLGTRMSSRPSGMSQRSKYNNNLFIVMKDVVGVQHY